MVKSVKLADIAEKLGVSVVTVSKALTGQKGVSEELRAKIKALADELGYTPIHSTQSTHKRSYTIGVITFEMHFAKLSSFYWKMYQELATRASKSNCFSLLEVICTVDENDLTPPKLITEGKVDGVVILGRPKKSYLKLLYNYNKVPMIFMDFYDDERKVTSVISSSYNGGYEITDYLIKKGHSRIAYLGTVMYTESITDRYFGYCKALMENGIEFRKDWVLNDRDNNIGHNGPGYVVALPKDMPTAFVCNNDVSAYALINQLEEKGYSVPGDISVVGYDDYLYPELGASKITTFSVDMARMSEEVLENLLKYLENGMDEPQIKIVTGKIIERETVKDIS